METLDRELLDMLINGLTNALIDPALNERKRTKTALRDALLQLDRLYPVVWRRENESSRPTARPATGQVAWRASLPVRWAQGAEFALIQGPGAFDLLGEAMP